MPANVWEYESRLTYYQGQRRQFEREARIAVGNAILKNELRYRGLDPGLYELQPTMFDGTPSKRSTGGGSGLLSKIGGAVGTAFDLAGDATETIFRGPIDRPWDLFRPAVQALQWEEEKIGRPLFKKGVTGAVTGLRMGIFQESPSEAWRKAELGYEELPGIVKLGGGMVFSPSTWVGPGLIAKGFKGVKVGTKLVAKSRFLSPLFGPQYPRLMGAAPEGASMQKILELSNKLPDLYVAKSSQEVIFNARSQFSISRIGKSMLLRSPMNRWINERWPSFFESDVAILNSQRLRIAAMFDSEAVAYGDIVGADFTKAFKLDKQNRLINLTTKKGATAKPTPFADFVNNWQKYDLNGLQKAFIKGHDEVFGLVREGELAFGVGTDIRVIKNGSYAHRQSLGKFAKLRDPASLEEYEKIVEAGPALRRRFGAKQSFEKELRIATQEQGEALGLTYMHPIEAQQVRIRQAGIRIADEWFKAAVEPIAKTPRQLMPSELSETLVNLLGEQTMLRRVANAIKSAGINGRFARPKNLTGEADGFATMITTRLNRLTDPGAVRAYLDSALADVNKSVKAVQAATRGPTRKWRALMKKVKQGGTPEFPTIIPGLGGRFAEYGEGRRLNQLLKPKQHGSIESTIIDINNQVRPVMANIDVSYLGIQGLIGLARNPAAYVKAVYYTMSQPELYDEYMRGFKASGMMDEFISVGGKLMARNDIGEFLFKGFITKLGVGPIKPFQLSNTWFTKFGNVMRSELYKGGRKLAIQKGMGKAVKSKGILMSREEFTREALYRGISDTTAGRRDAWWINKLDRAVKYAEATGVNPRVRVAFKRDIPSAYRPPKGITGEEWTKAVDRAIDDSLSTFNREGYYVESIARDPEFGYKLPIIGEVPVGVDPYDYLVKKGTLAEPGKQVFTGGIGREASLRQLAEVVGKATGYVPGEVSTVEQIALFAPRFFRAQLGLITDAVTRGDIAGAEARRMIGTLIVAGTTLVATINYAMGNETFFDPNSPNFLRIRALGRDISVFGPWDTLVKAASRLYSDGPIEAASYMARAKASPVVSQGWSIFITGETYRGEKLDWNSVESILTSVARISSSALPISVQQAAEGGIPKSPGEVAGTAIEFLGTKATPLSAFERLDIERQKLSLESFGVEWEELEPFQRRKLEQAYPKLTERPEAYTDIDKAFETRSSILDLYNEQQVALDKQIPVGPEWVEAYRKLSERKAGALSEWERQSPDAAASQTSNLESTDPNKRARAQYYSSFDQAKTSFGGLDIEKLSTILRGLEGSWTASQKSYVDRNTGLSASARVVEWRKAQDSLRPYWEITDQVWDLLREQPEYAVYGSLDEYIQSVAARLRQMGLPEETVELRISKLPVVGHMERAVNDLRRKFRAANPQADAALVKWYGYSPITTTRSKKTSGTVLPTLSLDKLTASLGIGALSRR